MIKQSQGYKGRIDTKICTYCGEPIDKASATADHLIPESRGGIRSNDNKVPACRRCNMMKGDMNVEEFKKFMERAITLEYSWVKIKTGYFKRVAIGCKNILQQSFPREIIIKDGETTDS